MATATATHTVLSPARSGKPALGAPLTYRPLPPDEWAKLKEVFHQNGKEPKE